MPDVNCYDCQSYGLYQMITSNKAYGYCGDIPCLRCARFMKNDEFVRKEKRPNIFKHDCETGIKNDNL